jgi:hypothetical protein
MNARRNPSLNIVPFQRAINDEDNGDFFFQGGCDGCNGGQAKSKAAKGVIKVRSTYSVIALVLALQIHIDPAPDFCAYQAKKPTVASVDSRRGEQVPTLCPLCPLCQSIRCPLSTADPDADTESIRTYKIYIYLLTFAFHALHLKSNPTTTVCSCSAE